MKKTLWIIVFLCILLALGGQVEAQGEPPAQSNEEWCLAAGQPANCIPAHEGEVAPTIGGYPYTPPANWACQRWFGLADDDVTDFLVANGWPEPIDIGAMPGATLDAKINYMLNTYAPFGPGDLLLIWWWASPFYNTWTFPTVLRVHDEFVVPGGKTVVTLEYAGFVAGTRPNYMLGILGSTLQLDMSRYVVKESARLIPPWNDDDWFYNQKSDLTDSYAVTLATGDLLNPTGGANTRAVYLSPTANLVVVGEQSVGAGIVFVDADSSRTDDLALWYYGRSHADQYEYVARRHSCVANPGDPVDPNPTSIGLLELEMQEASLADYWLPLFILLGLLTLGIVWRRRQIA